MAFQSKLNGDILDENHPSFDAFYNGICRRIRETDILAEVIMEFEKCKNDLERVTYVATTFKEAQDLVIKPDVGKDRTKSLLLEEEHDAICGHEDNYLKAKFLISRSIQTTPIEDKQSLAIRYMKRGWILLLLEQFNDALRDAQRSIAFEKVPTTIIWNAYEILGHCYAKLNQNKQSELCFKQAIDGLRSSDCSNEIKASTTMRISLVFKNVKGKKDFKKKNKYADDTRDKECPTVPQVSHGQHPVLENASAGVEVVESRLSGRGLFTTRDFKPGDIIIVEDPFVAALNPDCLDTHCVNCLARYSTPLPCPTCSLVWYCSESCLNQGNDGNLHSQECKILSLLYDNCIGVMALLVFRIMQKAKWKNLKSQMNGSVNLNTELHNNTTPSGKRTSLEWKETYSSSDYRTTLALVTNETKRAFGDLFKRSLAAIYIANCLKVTGFFGGSLTNDEFLHAASIVLQLSQSSSCNAYGITEYVTQQSGNSGISELGGAIYPTISLTNHSCSPNTIRYCTGTTCVLRAMKTIKKGTEVFDNYGPRFQVTSMMDRQDQLKSQYMFDCQCEACVDDWPVYPHVEAPLSFLCPAPKCNSVSTFYNCKKVHCSVCGERENYKARIIDIGIKLQEYAKGLEMLNKGHIDRALHILINHQIFLDRFGIPPGRFLTDSQESLRRCFFLQGNVVDMK